MEKCRTRQKNTSRKISKLIKFKCIKCGKSFIRYKVKERPQLFCSRICYLVSDQHRERQRQRMLGQKGEDNNNWKGKKAGYKAVHQWINRTYGKAKDFPCEVCKGKSGSVKMNWANIDHKYTRERKKWAILCKICHVKHDMKELGQFKNREKTK